MDLWGGWIYIENSVSVNLCDIETQKETDNVYVTLFRGLSVCQYVVVRHSECHAKHTQPCEVCAALCCVAARIL